MNEEKSPLVSEFVLSILESFSEHDTGHLMKKKHVLNADLIPKIYTKTNLSENLAERRIVPLIPIQQSMRVGQHPDLIDSGAPKKMAMPAPKEFKIPEGKYLKLEPLIYDDSISFIECPGAGKALVIGRYGQRIPTKIELNEEDIKRFLKTVAQEVRIPLVEGTFKAANDK